MLGLEYDLDEAPYAVPAVHAGLASPGLAAPPIVPAQRVKAIVATAPCLCVGGEDGLNQGTLAAMGRHLHRSNSTATFKLSCTLINDTASLAMS